MVHQCSKLVLYHVFHSYDDIMLIFKAQYLAMTLMHPVLCLWWKKGNTDRVQAEILELITVVCAMVIMESLVAIMILMHCSSM